MATRAEDSNPPSTFAKRISLLSSSLAVWYNKAGRGRRKRSRANLACNGGWEEGRKGARESTMETFQGELQAFLCTHCTARPSFSCFSRPRVDCCLSGRTKMGSRSYQTRRWGKTKENSPPFRWNESYATPGLMRRWLRRRTAGSCPAQRAQVHTARHDRAFWHKERICAGFLCLCHDEVCTVLGGSRPTAVPYRGRTSRELQREV